MMGKNCEQNDPGRNIMKSISLVLVLFLLFGVPLICGAQPEEEEEPIQAREINKVHTQGEAAVVQGATTEAGKVSATPIHLPNTQNQQTEAVVETTHSVQEGAKAGKVITEPAQTHAPHPKNELK
jgi:hypothetical protein